MLKVRVKAHLPSSYWPEQTVKRQLRIIPEANHFQRENCWNIFCQIPLKADLK